MTTHMTYNQHLDEAEQQYELIAKYAEKHGQRTDEADEQISKAVALATYHRQQAPLAQAAAFAANPALAQAVARRQLSRKRLWKAHAHSTYQEFDAAQKEWSDSFAACVQLDPGANHYSL